MKALIHDEQFLTLLVGDPNQFNWQEGAGKWNLKNSWFRKSEKASMDLDQVNIDIGFQRKVG